MRARAWVGWAFVVLAGALVAYQSDSTWDYPLDAGPPVNALVHGHVHKFLSTTVDMGPLSMIFRAPFAALTFLTGTDNDPFFNDQYRFGVFPCMVVAGALGLWLARELQRRGRSDLEQIIVVVLAVFNPVALRAIHFGHPEEVLGAALIVAAALAGLYGNVWLAAMLLAASLLNKQWALVAVIPVVLTAPLREWRKPALAAGAALVVVGGLLLIADAHGIYTVLKRMGDLRHTAVLPASIWWPITGVTDASARHHIPDVLGLVARPLLLVICFGTALACARRVRERPRERALPLLALILLLRCVLDPADNGYYHVPFYMALLAADVVVLSLVPTLVITAALYAITHLPHDPDILNLMYLTWALPTIAYLAARSVGYERSAGLRSRGVRGPVAARTSRPS